MPRGFGISPATIDATIYDAIGQRQVAQYFTQINSYHVVLEVTPAFQTDPSLFSKLYLTSPINGQQIPLSSFVKVDTTKTSYLSISHQSQFPAVTLSFNLAPGVALGQAVDAINKAQQPAQPAAGTHGVLPGHGQGLRRFALDPALPDRGGAGGRLHRAGACSTRVTSTR